MLDTAVLDAYSEAVSSAADSVGPAVVRGAREIRTRRPLQFGSRMRQREPQEVDS